MVILSVRALAFSILLRADLRNTAGCLHKAICFITPSASAPAGSYKDLLLAMGSLQLFIIPKYESFYVKYISGFVFIIAKRNNCQSEFSRNAQSWQLGIFVLLMFKDKIYYLNYNLKYYDKHKIILKRIRF